jgi:hypothetical protein
MSIENEEKEKEAQRETVRRLQEAIQTEATEVKRIGLTHCKDSTRV